MSSDEKPTEVMPSNEKLIWNGKECWQRYTDARGRILFKPMNRPARKAFQKRNGLKNLPLPEFEPFHLRGLTPPTEDVT